MARLQARLDDVYSEMRYRKRASGNIAATEVALYVPASRQHPEPGRPHTRDPTPSYGNEAALRVRQDGKVGVDEGRGTGA